VPKISLYPVYNKYSKKNTTICILNYYPQRERERERKKKKEESKRKKMKKKDGKGTGKPTRRTDKDRHTVLHLLICCIHSIASPRV